MSADRCPHCGQVVPPDLALPRILERLYAAVRERPRTSSELHDIVWFDDPNGGPEWRTLHVHIWRLNRRLAKNGVTVRSRPPDYRYRLYPATP
jgi:hypothetical protein